MAKNLIQDVIKIKNIREEKIEPKQNDGGFRYGLWLVALISIVLLLFAVSFLFSGAKITVNPKVKDLVLSQNLNAIKDSNDDNLPFDLVVMSGEEIKTIKGGEEKDVAEKAKGIVLIYNAFSISSQILSIDTRLEGSNGKMYKTEKQITVPGINTDGTPGSIEVGIYGIEAGAEYNSTPIDFKIFGFKGTPKYSKFYARSKGEIIGGLKGRFPQVSDVEKTTVINELKNILQEKLLKKVTDQIPSGYVLFKDAIFFSDDGGSTTGIASADGLVPINLKGTLYGFLFEEKKLTEKIVEANIDKYDESEVFIPNIQNLIFSLSDKETLFKDINNISFTLSGPVKIVWNVDSEKLINDLLGKKKGDFSQILSQYPNIDSADLVLKPIWNRTFPEKSKDIKVIINYPE